MSPHSVVHGGIWPRQPIRFPKLLMRGARAPPEWDDSMSLQARGYSARVDMELALQGTRTGKLPTIWASPAGEGALRVEPLPQGPDVRVSGAWGGCRGVAGQTRVSAVVLVVYNLLLFPSRWFTLTPSFHHPHQLTSHQQEIFTSPFSTFPGSSLSLTPFLLHHSPPITTHLHTATTQHTTHSPTTTTPTQPPKCQAAPPRPPGPPTSRASRHP